MAKQRVLKGMPDPTFSFEGTNFSKFRLALGGAADIELTEPIESGKLVKFTGEAVIVTTKLNKTSAKRTDIANLVRDSFAITSIEDAPEGDESDEDETDED